MEFRKKPETALAKMLAETVKVDGVVLAVPGDWLIQGEHGQHTIWPAKAFGQNYEPTATANPLALEALEVPQAG